MKPISFTEQTVVIAEDQPEYMSLPAYVSPKVHNSMPMPYDEERKIVFCWKLTPWERFKIIFTGKIWHSVLTFDSPLQPQMLELRKPFMRIPDE